MSRIWYNLRVKKILAVSGGIDSMVLLDMFYKKEPANILVAHFNHGTRDSADADEKFVKGRLYSEGEFPRRRPEKKDTIFYIMSQINIVV